MSDSETTGWKRITHRHYQKTIDGVLYDLIRVRSWPWSVFADKVVFSKDYHCIPDAKRAAHEHARKTEGDKN